MDLGIDKLIHDWLIIIIIKIYDKRAIMLMRNCLLPVRFMTFGCPGIEFGKVGNYVRGMLFMTCFYSASSV